MFEWSDTDLMVRDAVRQFVDKEVRPHLDELESGELSPYPIARKLFSQFGLDAMAAESVKKMLDRERAKQNGEPTVTPMTKSPTVQSVSVVARRAPWSRSWFPKLLGSASDC